MANLNSLETFISGDVFAWGINGTILAKNIKEENEHTFLVLFNSESGKVISSSKKLSDKDISLSADNETNGAILKINSIDSKYTKNYLLENENIIADGFALIRAKGKDETIGGSETVTFPNLEETYTIMLKSILSNSPIFSNGTSFQFNPTTVYFGVTGQQNGV